MNAVVDDRQQSTRRTRGAAVVLAVMLGVLLGAGGFTFRAAKGLSYMSPSSEACVNCHIMRDQYDGWNRSSHHAVASCIDCHLPHDLVGKYAAKAVNGFNHSKAFTLQNFDEPIRIHEFNRGILQDNCIACHREFVSQVTGLHALSDTDQVNCVRCHAGVGHGAPR